MKRLFAVLIVVFLALLGLALSANAQTPAVDVHVTVLGHAGPVTGSPSDIMLAFSGPVEIPRVALAPGEYIFRIVESSMTPRMQVFSRDRSTLYATFFVMPRYRNEVTPNYTVTLERMREGAPPRITSLFRPDTFKGYTLVYPTIKTAGGDH